MIADAAAAAGKERRVLGIARGPIYAAYSCALLSRYRYRKEQRALFWTEKSISDVKLVFVMDPAPIPVPEETQVAHL